MTTATRNRPAQSGGLRTNDKVSIALRPYQSEAADAFLSGISHGVKRSIINLPTGAGKTITGSYVAREIGGRCCWIAHRQELITQPAEAFSTVWPEATQGVVMADRHEPNADVVFVSVQSAIHEKRRRDLQGFDFVVVDESHHASAPSYRSLLEHLGCFRPDGPPLLGLTATVERADGIGLDNVFQSIAYQLPLLQAIQDAYLVDIVPRAVPLHVDLSNVHVGRGGDYNEDELADALLEAGVAEAVVDAILTHAGDRKSIVFTASVEQARLTSEALQKRDVAAAWLSGDTPPDERADILRRLKTGDLQAVANCSVLTEGFDETSVDCIVMARPTRSKTLYLQCIGRGLRRHPGKTDCLVLDVVGATRAHSLIQAPLLFGVEPKEAEGRPLTEAVAEAVNRRSVAERILEAAERVPDLKIALRWLEADAGLYALSAGPAGTVLLIERADGWHVRVTRQNEASLKLTGKGASLELAQGLAEDYARRADVTGIVKADAFWRNRPATEKQLRALEQWHVDIPEHVTAGQAADLLTITVARAKASKFRRGKEV